MQLLNRYWEKKTEFHLILYTNKLKGYCYLTFKVWTIDLKSNMMRFESISNTKTYLHTKKRYILYSQTRKPSSLFYRSIFWWIRLTSNVVNIKKVRTTKLNLKMYYFVSSNCFEIYLNIYNIIDEIVALVLH